MTSPKDLPIKEFSYDLPDEKIAKHPLEKRDESKMLVYRKGNIQEDRFIHLDEHLSEGSLVIFNNTKVVEARLLFKKISGTTIEIFCLEPADNYADITTAMLQTKKILWKCLVGNAKKWKNEVLIKTIQSTDRKIILSAKKISKQQENFIIEFFWSDDTLSFAEILHLAGVVPLPPYLNRNAEESDKKNYQTIYAKQDGSVAAPTAGLHFTDDVFKKLSAKNIEIDFITLHVGAGTFKPVKTETIEAHEMHEEFFEVSYELIENLLNRSTKIIAVGTTTLRTLESLYWMGVKIIKKSKFKSKKDITIEDVSIKQWDVYEMNDDNISVQESLNILLDWMKGNNLTKLFAKTQILIAPPYKLKIVNALVTNFHQPKSTLLLLIAAVIGDDWKRVYNYALQHDFRFLSYGDACLLMH